MAAGYGKLCQSWSLADRGPAGRRGAARRPGGSRLRARRQAGLHPRAGLDRRSSAVRGRRREAGRPRRARGVRHRHAGGVDARHRRGARAGAARGRCCWRASTGACRRGGGEEPRQLGGRVRAGRELLARQAALAPATRPADRVRQRDVVRDQYGDTYSDQSYGDRAELYAIRFAQAHAAIARQRHHGRPARAGGRRRHRLVGLGDAHVRRRSRSSASWSPGGRSTPTARARVAAEAAAG